MPAFVITNTGFIPLLIDGSTLEAGSCRGCLTPAIIAAGGEGAFFIACNADPDIPTGNMIALPIYDEDGNKIGTEEKTETRPASPVTVMLSDSLGEISTVEQNTRFPSEGSFPLLRPVTVA